ncbi:MAG: hypothetical protein ABH846_00910 [Patescibacteria group bacterium]
MNVNELLELIKKEQPVIVRDKTIQPNKVDEVRMETGESIYWVYTIDELWLSIDLVSEEVILFHDIEEEFDASEESLFYANDDYEFTFETSARIIDEDGEEEPINFRDYEESEGKVLRIYENEVSGDVACSVGDKITEEELQEV